MKNFYTHLLKYSLFVLPSIVNVRVKFRLIIMTFVLFNHMLYAQDEKAGKTRFVAGLSAPELFHAGATYRIANFSQVGVSAGVAPSWGETFTAISLEHRFYVGKNNERTNQKTYFFRQGSSFFPLSQEFTLNLSVGHDAPFKNSKNGITIDVGIFCIPKTIVFYQLDVPFDSYHTFITYPALRFELYFSL